MVMPIYCSECKTCGQKQEFFRKVSEYDDLPLCCGVKTTRVLFAPMVTADIQPYKSMHTGEMIGSRREHKEHLKKHNLIEVGNEKPKEIKRGVTKEQSFKIRKELYDNLQAMRT